VGGGEEREEEKHDQEEKKSGKGEKGKKNERSSGKHADQYASVKPFARERGGIQTQIPAIDVDVASGKKRLNRETLETVSIREKGKETTRSVVS